MIRINKNIDIYQKEDVVNIYSRKTFLLEPEKKILSIIKDDIKNAKVLDIGVGGGRTTLYFSKKAKRYVGIDYSSKMIDICNEKYGTYDTISFKVLAARNLDSLEKKYFDIILFSYNGLDCIDIKHRKNVLEGITKLLKDGGKFIFSMHNINHIKFMYNLYSGYSPKIHIKRFFRIIRLLMHNGFPAKYEKMDYTQFTDSAHNFRNTHTYSSLPAEINTLKHLGYSSIRAFSCNNGDEMMLKSLKSYTEPWVYFYCLKN